MVGARFKGVAVAKIELLLPSAEIDAKQSKLAPRVPSLEGRKFGFIDHHKWPSMAIARDELEKVLSGEYGATSVGTLYLSHAEYTNQPKYMDLLKDLSSRVDVVLSGLGY